MRETEDPELLDPDRELEQFRVTLRDKMQERGWKQIDLAREAFGTETDTRGVEVAKGRERISSYMTGRSRPSTKSVHLIAKALEVSPMELAPWLLREALAEKPRRPANGDDKTEQSVHLSIDCTVSSACARKIYDLIREEKIQLSVRLTDKHV